MTSGSCYFTYPMLNHITMLFHDIICICVKVQEIETMSTHSFLFHLLMLTELLFWSFQLLNLIIWWYIIINDKHLS